MPTHLPISTLQQPPKPTARLVALHISQPWLSKLKRVVPERYYSMVVILGRAQALPYGPMAKIWSMRVLPWALMWWPLTGRWPSVRNAWWRSWKKISGAKCRLLLKILRLMILVMPCLLPTSWRPWMVYRSQLWAKHSPTHPLQIHVTSHPTGPSGFRKRTCKRPWMKPELRAPRWLSCYRTMVWTLIWRWLLGFAVLMPLWVAIPTTVYRLRLR